MQGGKHECRINQYQTKERQGEKGKLGRTLCSGEVLTFDRLV